MARSVRDNDSVAPASPSIFSLTLCFLAEVVNNASSWVAKATSRQQAKDRERGRPSLRRPRESLEGGRERERERERERGRERERVTERERERERGRERERETAREREKERVAIFGFFNFFKFY